MKSSTDLFVASITSHYGSFFWVRSWVFSDACQISGQIPKSVIMPLLSGIANLGSMISNKKKVINYEAITDGSSVFGLNSTNIDYIEHSWHHQMQMYIKNKQNPTSCYWLCSNLFSLSTKNTLFKLLSQSLISTVICI